MIHQPVIRHLLIFRAWTTIIGIGIDADASTGSEDASDLNILGVHQTDEILHDDVDTVFMEVTMIAEREEVELQGFAFHHALVGQVGDANLCKVGLSRNGQRDVNSGQLNCTQ